MEQDIFSNELMVKSLNTLITTHNVLSDSLNGLTLSVSKEGHKGSDLDFFVTLLKEQGKYSHYLMLEECKVLSALVKDYLSYSQSILLNLNNHLIAPAIAVSRRPFMDTLFFIEWMIVDSRDFIEKLYFDEVESYVPYGKDSRYSARRKRIHDEISELYKKDSWSEISALVYGFRYDKKSEKGLQFLFQRANHIVTTYGVHKSLPGELNFVGNSVKLELRNFFVGRVLVLHLYTLDILIKKMEMMKLVSEVNLKKVKLATDKLTHDIEEATRDLR